MILTKTLQKIKIKNTSDVAILPCDKTTVIIGSDVKSTAHFSPSLRMIYNQLGICAKDLWPKVF